MIAWIFITVEYVRIITDLTYVAVMKGLLAMEQYVMVSGMIILQEICGYKCISKEGNMQPLK